MQIVKDFLKEVMEKDVNGMDEIMGKVCQEFATVLGDCGVSVPNADGSKAANAGGSAASTGAAGGSPAVGRTTSGTEEQCKVQ